MFILVICVIVGTFFIIHNTISKSVILTTYSKLPQLPVHIILYEDNMVIRNITNILSQNYKCKMISLVTNKKKHQLQWLLQQTCKPITIGGLSGFLDERDASIQILFLLQKPNNEILQPSANELLNVFNICNSSSSNRINNFRNMIIFKNTIPLDFIQIYTNKLL